jgi:uncharacterized protein YfaS (alpha-2-macroglobulin family)
MEILRKHLQSFRLFRLILVLVVALPFEVAGGETFTATYTRNALSLTIPYHAVRAGSGKLVVEILDPEDDVLGRVERSADVAEGDGAWKQEVTISKPLPLEDIVWERVRYRFQYSGEKAAAFEQTRSVSEILAVPVVHIIGQTSYLAGGPAAVRVIVSDSKNREIAGNCSIHVDLLVPGHAPRTLFVGRLNRRGTTEAQFQFPAGLAGNFQLHYVADTPLGSAESTQPVRLEDKVSILLTTEKPIYQPGQTIHVRALELDRADHHAAAGKLTFEIEDSRSNKVFKKITETDAFGIASAEFTLADEVNLGVYHLRALTGDAENPANTAELALNVQRYVLPKFKVAIDFTAKDNKPKRDYRPGKHVTGTVRANYFFGKPVDDAEIAIKASSIDVSLVEAGAADGKTDKDGTYHFDLKLPPYFAGRGMNKGAAPVLIEATVKDASGHSETRGERITVSQSSLLITAVPESGKLIPGLENQVFVLTSYADGTPASAELHVRIAGAPDQKVETDKGGVAVVRVTPSGRESLRIEADDQRGNRASSTLELQTRDGEDQILLRADRAVYKAGERIELSVFSTQQRGSAYIDIVKDGQTILTRDLDVVNGHADLALRATPQMSGTLDINVYRFGRDAQPIGDHRLVFVQPADELRIDAVADASVYKPGAEANIRFRVTNEHGEGVRAALGLQVVDEAVFALAEKQPGFAKVFFYLEQELMKPRYEIHSLSMTDVVQPASEPDAEVHDRAARALFSATEMVTLNKLDTEFGRSVPQAKAAEFTERYRAAFSDRVWQIAAELSKVERTATDKNIPQLFATLLDKDGTAFRDAWGNEFHLEPSGYGRNVVAYYRIRSAGPDGRFDTADDFTSMIEVHTGMIVGGSGQARVGLKIEHDRGPFNGLAEITGSVTDPSGAVIPRAIVTLRQVSRASHKAVTNAEGLFTLSGIPAGTCEIQITAPGFAMSSRRFTVQPRDLAIVSSTLLIGAVSEAVTVNAEAGQVVFKDLAINGRFDRNAAGTGMALAGLAAPAAMPAQKRSAIAQDAAPDHETHVRSYFPEALYINPEIITDGNGVANITIPIVDSITTWRMAMFASTKSGALGTNSSALKVFQDFFVDLDLPVTLTQGDRVSIPVAVYNYADGRGDVTLTLQHDDWFSLVDDSAEKSLAVDAGHVGGSQFTLEAKRIGKFKLTLSARMKGAAERQDIVVREIEVIPNGREQSIVFNGGLDSSSQQNAKHTVQFPAGSIPDASKIFVRLYPGPLSQVIEGMDSILRMPGGCFEQTSSSTYPNVLALDYMKRTKKLTPEVHAKAEGYIANGYQRLLTFEVAGGGFSWFGSAPANKILTAYGLMEFNDMAKVHDVDPRLIARTHDWLVAQQQADGSWKPDTAFINEGATNHYNSDVLRITAYIAWALENTGQQSEPVEKAKRFIEAHLSGKPDTYTLAVLANFAVEYGKDEEFTRQVMQMLFDARTEKGEQVSWNSEETGVYSTGPSAAIETTGLAAQALLKWRHAPEMTRKALAFIAAKKQASGDWGTTQATIMALRALLIASEESASDVRGSVEVMLNGSVTEKLALTPENNDLFHQFALPVSTSQEPNNVEIRFSGSGGLAYQVVGRYFTPWESTPVEEPLSIAVTYDRTKLAQNDIVTATAKVRNNLSKTANMVMVDLGIPPGFELLSEDLQTFEEKTAGAKSGGLEKFSLTATQAILYFNAFAPKSTVELRFRLRAKYPIQAKTFQSRVYEYYDPAVSATARPVQLEVSGR